MRAIIFEKPGDVRYTTVDEPTPGPGQVLLEVEACGLCGTDVHSYLDEYPSPFPYIPGHEMAGLAIAVGPGGDASLVGRRFAVHPILPCGSCAACAAGRIQFCPDMRVYGFGLSGGFAERTVVDVSCLAEVPAHVSGEIAAFAEPLACVLHGLKKVGVHAGDRVLLFGAGPIGLLLLQASRALGAASVDVVDLVAEKVAIGERVGGIGRRTADLQPEAYDLVIDATGVPAVVAGLLTYVKSGGRALLFGVCPPQSRVEFSPYEIFRRELTIVGCFSLAYEFTDAVAMLVDGRVDVRPLISARLPLAAMAETLRDHGSGAPTIKTLFVPSLG